MFSRVPTFQFNRYESPNQYQSPNQYESPNQLSRTPSGLMDIQEVISRFNAVARSSEDCFMKPKVKLPCRDKPSSKSVLVNFARFAEKVADCQCLEDVQEVIVSDPNVEKMTTKEIKQAARKLWKYVQANRQSKRSPRRTFDIPRITDEDLEEQEPCVRGQNERGRFQL